MKEKIHLTQTRITDLAVKVILEIVISNISSSFRFYFLLLLFREWMKKKKELLNQNPECNDYEHIQRALQKS